MIYPIRLFGDPILRSKSRTITDLNTPVQVPGFQPVRLEKLAENMFDSMFEARGVGLAAPQIGLPIRMFVMAEYEDEEEEETHEGEKKPLRSRVKAQHVFINPTLTVLNKKKDRSYTEGCLSIPGVYEEGVPRWRQLNIQYQDLSGKMHSEDAEDYLARVMQHEHDHLEGKLFLDHLPPDISDEYRKDLAAMHRKARAYLKFLKERGE